MTLFSIRLWASYYAPDKISRALSLGCILLFAAIVVVLVKTAKCGAAYNPYTACFDTMTGQQRINIKLTGSDPSANLTYADLP
jgi:hypothetical protein